MRTYFFCFDRKSEAQIASQGLKLVVNLFSLKYDTGQWNPEKGEAKIFQGKGHKAQVTDMAMSGLTLATCSMDDTVRLTSTKSLEYG